MGINNLFSVSAYETLVSLFVVVMILVTGPSSLLAEEYEHVYLDKGDYTLQELWGQVEARSPVKTILNFKITQDKVHLEAGLITFIKLISLTKRQHLLYGGEKLTFMKNGELFVFNSKGRSLDVEIIDPRESITYNQLVNASSRAKQKKPLSKKEVPLLFTTFSDEPSLQLSGKFFTKASTFSQNHKLSSVHEYGKSTLSGSSKFSSIELGIRPHSALSLSILLRRFYERENIDIDSTIPGSAFALQKSAKALQTFTLPRRTGDDAPVFKISYTNSSTSTLASFYGASVTYKFSTGEVGSGNEDAGLELYTVSELNRKLKIIGAVKYVLNGDYDNILPQGLRLASKNTFGASIALRYRASTRVVLNARYEESQNSLRRVDDSELFSKNRSTVSLSQDFKIAPLSSFKLSQDFGLRGDTAKYIFGASLLFWIGK